MTAEPSQKLLQIENLVLHFKTSQGVVQAVDSVDFELNTNRAVVILGESGCGKSSLAKAMLRLFSKGLVASSACMGGVVSNKLWALQRGECTWEDVAQAASDAFWTGFDADPLPALEFLENRIAPQTIDGDMIWVRYVGTDLERESVCAADPASSASRPWPGRYW